MKNLFYRKLNIMIVKKQRSKEIINRSAFILLLTFTLIYANGAEPVRIFFANEKNSLQSPDDARRTELILRNAGFDISQVNEGGIKGMIVIEGFTERGVIILAGVSQLPQTTIDHLSRFVKDGGRLLWLEAPAVSVRKSALLREMLGFDSLMVSWKDNNIEVLFNKHFISVASLTLTETSGQSVTRLTTGNPLAFFKSIRTDSAGEIAQLPGIILNQYGQGKVLTFNWPADRSQNKNVDDLIVRSSAWLAANGDEVNAAALISPSSSKIIAQMTGLSASIPHLTPTEAAKKEAEPDYSKAQGMRKGVYVGVSNICDYSRVGLEPLKEMATFRNMINIVKAAGINTVCLYPMEGDSVIFKSKYLKSHKYDLLREFCDAIHAEGLKAEIYFLERDPYFGGDLSGYRNKIECIWDFKNKWSNILQELSGYDLDGMCVAPDEFWSPAHQGTPGTDDPCTAKFREWYGYEPPKEIGDNKVSRSWIQYGYRALGEVFSSWNDLVKQRNPKIIRSNIIYVGGICYNRACNISYDIVGHAADFDYMMTDPYVGLHVNLRDHYYVPEVVKHLEGSIPSHRSMITLQAARLRNYQPELRPVYVYGEAISALASGTDGIYYFHFGIIGNSKTGQQTPQFKNAELTFSAMRTLERWGIEKSFVPTQIALLFSQRSQDYADLRKDKDMGNGYEAQEKGNDLLLANGYPYRLYYLEQENDWKDVSGLKVIILPFIYTISDNAILQLEDHLRTGKRLIILQRVGEADENGEIRSEPALAKLARLYPKQVFSIPGEVFAGFNDPVYVNQFLKTMNNALGNDKLISLNRYGRDVEVSALQLPDKKIMLFAINWEPGDISIEMGVNMPEGTYRLTERNLEGTQAVTIDNRKTLKAKDLKNFAVDLREAEFKIWLVEPYL